MTLTSDQDNTYSKGGEDRYCNFYGIMSENNKQGVWSQTRTHTKIISLLLPIIYDYYILLTVFKGNE